MQRLPVNRTCFISALVAVLVVLAFAIGFPGLTPGNILLQSAVILLAVYAAARSAYASPAVVVAIAVAAMLLGVGVSLNAWFFTTYSGGTPEMPVLLNDDSNRWWNYALYYLGKNEGVIIIKSYGQYAYVLAAFLWLAGATVGAALIWSEILILASLLLCGVVAYRLTQNRRISALAIICCGGVCYWLSMGTLILKDAFIILAILIGGLSFTSKTTKSMFGFFVLALLMLLVSRLPFIFLLCLGAVVVASKRKNLWFILAMVALAIVCSYIFSHYVNMRENISIPDAQTSGVSFQAPHQMAYFNALGNYLSFSLLKKIVLLPVAAGVQYLIPFSWTWARDIPFGLTQAWAHFGYIWYFFGFVFAYYLFTNIGRYKTMIYRLSFWAACCWLTTCFATGGTVSRYGLPFVALMAPAVAVTLYGNYKNKRFYIVMVVFAVVLSLTLILAHKMQMAAME